MTGPTRDNLIAVSFLWFVFSIIGFEAASVWVDKWTEDASLAAHIGGAAVLGAFATIAGIVFFWLCHLLLDRLPLAIRRALRTPLEKYADLVNSRTERGYEERRKLMARLEFIIESERMREKIFRDPETGQHWIEAYVEASWSSWYDMIPVDAGRAARLIANYRQETQA